MTPLKRTITFLYRTKSTLFWKGTWLLVCPTTLSSRQWNCNALVVDIFASNTFSMYKKPRPPFLLTCSGLYAVSSQLCQYSNRYLTPRRDPMKVSLLPQSFLLQVCRNSFMLRLVSSWIIDLLFFYTIYNSSCRRIVIKIVEIIIIIDLLWTQHI